MKNLIILGALAVVLSGCAGAESFRASTTKSAAAAKDIEARILIDAAGAVGLRAWSRLSDPHEKCGLLLLSGIPCSLTPSSAIMTVPQIPIETPELPSTGE